MEVSGYPVSVASTNVRNGLLNYTRRVQREKDGKGRLHRPAEEGSSLRRRRKFCGKTSLFRPEVAESCPDEQVQEITLLCILEVPTQ